MSYLIGGLVGIVFMSGLRVVLFRIDKMAKEYKQRQKEDAELLDILAKEELNKING